MDKDEARLSPAKLEIMNDLPLKSGLTVEELFDGAIATSNLSGLHANDINTFAQVIATAYKNGKRQGDLETLVTTKLKDKTSTTVSTQIVGMIDGYYVGNQAERFL